MSRAASLFLGIAAAALITASQTFFIVPQSQQVIVLMFGEPTRQYSEPGLKAKIPFIQQLKVFDRRVLDVDPPPEELILADQKRLVVDTFARYRITDMLKFWKALGGEQQATTRLTNLINSTLRGRLGSVTLQDLLSEKRGEIMAEIQEQVNQSVQRFGLEIVDVRIGRADLPEQTSQSIFARMRSEREREAAEFRAQGTELAQQIKSKADRDRTVLLAEAEKQAQMNRGQGDEQAISIYANAFEKDPSFYRFYRTLEAYRSSLKGEDTMLVLSPDSEFLRYLDNISPAAGK